MPALVLLFPLIAMCWDQGLYPHRAQKQPALDAAVAHVAPVACFDLTKPYPEFITLITEDQ